MTIKPHHFAPLVGAISILIASPAGAQEFFRDFGTSRSSSGTGRLGPGRDIFLGNDPYAFSSLSEADLQKEERRYNIRIGSFDMAIAAGVGFEFNDNITLADNDRLSDIIFRPQFDIEGAIRFSEASRLRIGVGVGYAKFFNNSQFDSDSVLVSPNSSIVWTAEAGAFKFTVRERFSYQEDPFNQPTLSNVPRYKRYENQAGIQVDWDANQYTKIAVGYDRYDLWAKDKFFRSQDRGVNTIFFRPSYQLSPSFTFGLSSSLSFISYREKSLQTSRPDGKAWLLGPFLKWQASDYTDVYVEVGYQRTSFDGSTLVQFINPFTGSPATSRDEDEGSAVYAKIDITNRPSEFLSHRLSMSKTAELGFDSNFFDLYHIEYSMDWAIQEKTTLHPVLFYQYYEASGAGGEKAHRFGAALGLYHVFSENLTAGLDYRFLVKDSNLPEADYYQNLGMVSLYYKF